MAKAYQCDRCKSLCLEARDTASSTFHTVEEDKEPFIVIVSFRKTDVKNEHAELCSDCCYILMQLMTKEVHSWRSK